MLNDISKWRVLALSPHTDDAELGAGGLLARLVKAGCHVQYLAFSYAKSASGNTHEECERSLATLGITDAEVIGWPGHSLLDRRQEVLEKLLELRGQMPDLVLTPTRHDVHQSHQAVVNEAIRAFKHTRILGYDMPWNTVGPEHVDFYVPLSEEDMRMKEQALASYKGQHGRPFFAPDVVRATARYRGEQVGHLLAEAYEAIRWIW